MALRLLFLVALSEPVDTNLFDFMPFAKEDEKDKDGLLIIECWY